MVVDYKMRKWLDLHGSTFRATKVLFCEENQDQFKADIERKKKEDPGFWNQKKFEAPLLRLIFSRKTDLCAGKFSASQPAAPHGRFSCTMQQKFDGKRFA